MMETIKGVGAGTGPSLWSSFWRDVTPDGALHERCHVPSAGRHVTDRHWTQFADSLPSGARVLDLACGAGVVGRLLLGRRGDLRVTGVDWAGVPVAQVPNLTIHPWVRMEALPFEANSFDAAVSLFGIEYGDIGAIAEELARVLKPGAHFGFLVHHCDSEILREGTARRRALRETLSGKMKAAFLSGSAEAVEQQRERLHRTFPAEPTARLLVDHLRRNTARTRVERHTIWQKLTADFDPEIALLAQLERSAKSVSGLGIWLAALLSGMSLVNVFVLRCPSGVPIAWSVSGRR